MIPVKELRYHIPYAAGVPKKKKKKKEKKINLGLPKGRGEG